MDNSESRLLGMIGICRGAGATVIGVPMICERLRSHTSDTEHIIVFEASDTSFNTHKRITDKCDFYKVRHVRLASDCETLGRAVGKSAVAAVAVTGESFCRAVGLKIPQSSEPEA